MLFVEARFLGFFLLVFAVHWLLRPARARKLWLLAASYAFYGAWDWRFLFLIAGSSVLDYVCGARMAADGRAGTRRGWLVLSLAGNLGALALFKYFDFFVDSGVTLLGWLGVGGSAPALELVLPVGISFFTFQSMSYTIDVYRGRLAPVHGVTDFLLFVAFFPQLVAGPIVRASEFLPQLTAPRRFENVDVRGALMLFWIGFFKKACLADHLATVVDPVFTDPGAHGAAGAWLGLAAYTAQIYCDFSGYTDMALGAAGLLGYRLVENFRHPYLARSITEFWRRWHISLSTWFRDYLYVPLGGNRGGTRRTYRNLLIVFLLCGLWHGAAWTFVLWGAYHGGFLVLERLGLRRLVERPGLGVVYQLLVVAIGWVLFRSASLEQAGTYLTTLFSSAPAQVSPGGPWWFILGGAFVVHCLTARTVARPWWRRLPDWGFGLAFGALVALTLPWVAIGTTPFIYFQF